MRRPLIFLSCSVFFILYQAKCQTVEEIFNSTNTPIFSTNVFNTVAVGPDGTILAGTPLQGLYRYRENSWEKSGVLLNHTINQIKTDRDGGFWIAQSGSTGGQATGGGVSYLPNNSDLGYRNFNSTSGAPTRNARSIFVSNFPLLPATSMTVWSAHLPQTTGGVTQNGGIGRGLTNNGYVTIRAGIDLANNIGGVQTIGGNLNEVWAFAPANYGQSQILRYNSFHGQFLGYFDATVMGNIVPNNFTAKAIAFDRLGRAWIGLNSGGLVLYDGGQWSKIASSAIFPPNATVNNNAITADENGFVYIGTSAGLLTYLGGDINDPNNYTLFGVQDGLPSPNIRSIAVDTMNQKLVLATDAGIAVLSSLKLDVYNLEGDNSEVRNEMKYDTENIRVSADGTTSTLFKFRMKGANNLQLRIKENNSNEAELYGKLSTLRSHADSIVFLYQHPSKPDIPENSFSRLLHLELFLSGKPNPILKRELEIVRPPLLLVHGLWSNGEGAFGKMKKLLLSQQLYKENQVKFANYDGAAPFAETVSEVVADKKDLKRDALKIEKISFGKIDVAGHSMGGILLRLYIQSEAYEQDVNKYVSFNTPHSGSPIANYVSKSTTLKTLVRVFKFENPDGGALDDLKVNSDGIRKMLNGNGNLNRNLVPSHAIVSSTDLFTTPLEELNPLTNPLEVHDFYHAYIRLHNGIVYLRNELFNGEPYDIVVSIESQSGGLPEANVTPITDQNHSSTTAPNDKAYKTFVNLLNLDKSDSKFHQNGFNPKEIKPLPGLESTPKRKRNYVESQMTTLGTSGVTDEATLKITSPQNDSKFDGGQDISIQLTHTGIDTILIAFGHEHGFYANYIPITSNVVTFKVPPKLIGNIPLLVLGFNETGYVAVDSLKIFVDTKAQLDSLTSANQHMEIPQSHSRIFHISGHFNDMITRNLTSVSGVNVTFVTGNAALTAAGEIVGNQVGIDTAIVSYLGKTTKIAIDIVPESNWFKLESIPVVVPIKLTNFSGLRQGNHVRLNWTTTFENNSSHFHIQRSFDGISFSKIGTVNSKNSLNGGNYIFIDTSISRIRGAETVYYRLEHQDYDDKKELSRVITLRIVSHNIAFKITPNPVRSTLNLSISDMPRNEKAMILVRNLHGVVIQRLNVLITAGSSVMSFPVINLPAGEYFMTIQSETINITSPFIMAK